MKVLVYATGHQGPQEASQLDEALIAKQEGHEIIYLACDNSMGICMQNSCGSKNYCKLCMKNHKKRACKLGLAKEFHFVSEFATKDIDNKINNFPLIYSNFKDIKRVKYEGVDVGYGAMSSYVTTTRNVDTITPEVKEYLDYNIKKEIYLYEIVKHLHSEHHFDKIVFHNGRLAQYKPLLGLSKNYNLSYVCTETFLLDGKIYKNYFYDDIAHSIKANQQKYIEHWNNYGDTLERESVARSFFNNRRNAVFAGDKIYVADQKKGMMPSDWDSSKENIVIFNSSQDEFVAIDEYADSLAFFESQITGIKTIVEHYKTDNSKHFYLRIHPNLKDVKYRYHLDLLDLDYPNLTVIPGDSPISSYSLLDAASQVIVFGSTMGVEAAYWGKKTTCLDHSLYQQLDVAYYPKSLDDLWKILDDKSLAAKPQENALPYGLFYMSKKQPVYEHIDNRLIFLNFRGIHMMEAYRMDTNIIWYEFLKEFLRKNFLRKGSKLFNSVPK